MNDARSKRIITPAVRPVHDAAQCTNCVSKRAADGNTVVVSHIIVGLSGEYNEKRQGHRQGQRQTELMFGRTKRTIKQRVRASMQRMLGHSTRSTRYLIFLQLHKNPTLGWRGH